MYAYRGPSALNGAPIVAILTGASANGKTGNMATLWILAEDEAPHVAQRTGKDAAVCGACPLRPANGGGCYVTTFQGPRSTWSAHRRAGAPVSLADACTMARDAGIVRLGGYGDPAALPFETVQAIAESAPRSLGYTHAWRTCDPRFRTLCMASVSSAEEAREAQSAGWRTFRVRAGAERGGLQGREVTCPASAEAGKRTTCATCGLCDGMRRGARVNVAIDAHGAQAGRVR